jgi:hypothetical protein
LSILYREIALEIQFSVSHSGKVALFVKIIFGKNKTAFKRPRDGLSQAFGSPMIGVVFDDYNRRNKCSAIELIYMNVNGA